MSDPALPIATTFIAQREAFVGPPYQDDGRGVWTYGYGFITQPDSHPVTEHTPPVTQDAAYARLQGLVGATLVKVRDMVHVPITDNQAAALVSLGYNIGTGALRTSTLMDRLNARAPMVDVAACFASWVYAGGRFNQGLANRRAMEAALFLRADGVSIPDIAIPISEQDQQVTRTDDISADELDDLYNPAPAGTSAAQQA